ncbi:MAG: AAA family ATPase [Clostridia bacterium]|nr:AAA family ATPase [Clostridia bacterium]
MNKLEKEFFELLHKDRAESADMLEKPSMRGIKNSVVEKYSDQAHFIYELLQNADDANATTARFILEPERLIYAHNGTRHFSVSNPETEDMDSESGVLGDINAITSIANSNKTEASIGKFGVGFKAVFQYTSTPHIYGPDFKFRIDRFIVPTLLENDFVGRKPDETLFVFPFDHSERSAKEAYEDISEKLRNLSFPLLFLSKLKNIEFEFENVLGLYGKEIVSSRLFDDTVAEKICLTQNDGDNLYDENLWLFSRLDDLNRRYSVGFFLDEKGQLRPINEPAFCFFPTKEVTNLNFIVHAPFLLTDSREGIRAGVLHNDNMLEKLAMLAADSMVYLRDIGSESSVRLITDNILNIIPVDSEVFSDPSDKRKVSFLPFYNAIKDKFASELLLPTKTGYVATTDAYWAAVPQLTNLFSDSQLALVCENDNAHWAFVGLGRDETQRNNKALFSYIDSLVKTNLNEEVIINGRTRGFYYGQQVEVIKGITTSFIEKQPIDWLHSFYKWLSETKHRTELITEKPVFLDQEGNASAAYDEDEQLILFLPVKDITGYKVVHPELLTNPETVKFLKDIGIKEPSLRDRIYNIILPQYEEGGAIDTDPHFKIFFDYYCKCSNDEVDEFIDLIKECEFLTYYDEGDPQAYRGSADTMYLPTPEIRDFLETKKETRFIAIDEYREIVGPEKEKELISFLCELGIKTKIQILDVDVDYYSSGRNDLPYCYSTRGRTWHEKIIDGCKEIVAIIEEQYNVDKSVALWNTLLSIIESQCSKWRDLDDILIGKHEYFYYSSGYKYFVSSDVLLLKNSSWLCDKDEVFVKPENLTKESLSSIYDTSSEFAEQLIEFLGIQSDMSSMEKEDNSNLTDSQREKVEFADRIRELGITEEDLDAFAQFQKARKARESTCDDDSFSENEDIQSQETIPTRKLHKTTSRVAQDILNRMHNTPIAHTDFYEDENIDTDSDEYMPTLVDYSRKTELAKEKAAREIDKIAYQEELQQRALDAEKYSYGWFKALLELETLNSNTNALNSKEVSISFARVEREPGTQRTLVLKQPNRYIPQFMEDLADIPLVLHFGDQTKTLAIEVANVKSYTLRVKLKSHVDISEIDFSKVTEARIDAQSPVFLLEELRKQINALSEEFGYEDSFNMQENLCENIEFVFGPPGTGKTTYLAKNVIMPLMSGTEEPKVLVLTPTNKSADVLARRIMEVMGDDTTYNDWLVRFGGTGDETIEDSPIFRDKSFDIRTLNKNVTITTIARFPYDFFMPQGARIFLNGIKWDYIIIDEASMIPLVNMIYPLYKKTPKKFIIAGDPFQIEPITSVDLWRNENIYTMVKLDSFENPSTIPHDYKVELLTTQYRSIPSVGSVFSKFAYGGILEHYRKESDRKPLNIGDTLKIEPLNLIKFPVSKYESIYRCKRLQHSSSYQIYSALFTFEFAHYMAKKIASTNVNSIFRIGIIAPYRAQADLIDKLICSKKIPANIDIQVGTIHGFQGDECDAIFVVLNTPPSISASKEMFLNKRNIINVAISRAKDYLFLIMPDDDTENIQNLRLVKRVEQLAKSIGCYTEVKSPEIENLMFGSSTYFEDNAFSTGHQSVNVYGLPEKRYEIRSEDTAVDIQIHRSRKESASENMTLNKGDKQNVLSNVSTKTITNGRAYQAGDNIKGKRISLHIGDGEIIQGIVLDDRSNIISVQHTDDKGNRVVEKFKIDISTRKKRIRIFE